MGYTTQEVLDALSRLKSDFESARRNGNIVGPNLVKFQKDINGLDAQVTQVALFSFQTPTTKKSFPFSMLLYPFQYFNKTDDTEYIRIMRGINKMEEKISATYLRNARDQLKNLPKTGVFLEPNAGEKLFDPWYDTIRRPLTSVIKSNYATYDALKDNNHPALYKIVLDQNKLIQDIARRIGEMPYVASELHKTLTRCQHVCDWQESLTKSFLCADGKHVVDEIFECERQISLITKDLMALMEDQDERLEDLKSYIPKCGDEQPDRVLPGLDILYSDLSRESLGNLLQDKHRQWDLKIFTGKPHIIGRGASGGSALQVARVIHEHQEYALKVLKFEEQDEPRVCLYIARELEALRSLKHKRVLPIIGIWIDGPGNGFPSIVTGWCNGGDLHNLVRTGKVTLQDKLRLTMEAAEGLHYLHTREKIMVHADIKGANVLVHDNHALLADFGLSRTKNQQHGYTTDGRSYTGSWRAPEITLAGQKSQPPAMQFANPYTDMYAFGCLLLEVMIEGIPLEGTSSSPTFSSVRRRNPNNTHPETLLDAPHPKRLVTRELYDSALSSARSSTRNSSDYPIIKEHWDLMKKFRGWCPWERPSAKDAVKHMKTLLEAETKFLSSRSEPSDP